MLEMKAKKFPRTLALPRWPEIRGRLLPYLRAANYTGLPVWPLSLHLGCCLRRLQLLLLGSQVKNTFLGCELLGLQGLRVLGLMTVAVTPAPFTA